MLPPKNLCKFIANFNAPREPHCRSIQHHRRFRMRSMCHNAAGELIMGVGRRESGGGDRGNEFVMKVVIRHSVTRRIPAGIDGVNG